VISSPFFHLALHNSEGGQVCGIGLLDIQTPFTQPLTIELALEGLLPLNGMSLFKFRGPQKCLFEYFLCFKMAK